MKRLIVIGSIIAVFASLFVGSSAVLAQPLHPNIGGLGGAGVLPAGAKLRINIVYNVRNDEDSGNVGYWALDSYLKTVQVWMTPSNGCYAIATYVGQWQTVAGAKSPGAGAKEGRDASGVFLGGYIATFTCTSCTPTKGYVGSFDFGGTRADILKGTYGNGQTGAPHPFDYLATYFTGVSGFTYVNWGWTYFYRNQTWRNLSSGTSGDIVT